jgi:GNAT superfamily N-acetyltransferase
MAASTEAILLALENSIFELPEIPGRWEVLDFPGVRAHATPQTSHPIGNLVGIATLTEETANAVIAQVRDFFAERAHTVGWWVNPSSTPGDLGIRLEAAGFAKVLTLAGQVLTHMGLAIKVNPAVTVRQATPDDRDDLIRVYSTAYPLPEELAAVWTDVLPLAAGGRHYMAFLDGVEGPVSVASMFPFPKSTVAVMQGAATLNDYRGKGVYTALMATRLADARDMGMAAAILQADRTTSAPICANLGFEEVCSIDLYAWGNG